jgi:hypothetical protein
MYAFTTDNPMQRETVPYERTRIDQEKTPGEQTLTSWWIRSQESFHGGAGQLYLEPPIDSPVASIRFSGSKNVDVFTPSRVTRLPDTAVVTTDPCVAVVGLAVSGVDALAYLTAVPGTVKLMTSVTGAPAVSTCSGVSNVLALSTDGSRIYAATATDVWAINPATPTAATKLATYPASATSGPVLGWVKSRLMLGVNGAVYQVDVSQSGVTLGASQLLFQHPTPGWTWRCFAESPTAILSAGDAYGVSEIAQYTLNDVAGAPTLQVGGTIASMPVGERILSLRNVMGTYLVIGTTHGVRVGQFDSFWSRLTWGPLELLPTDPTIPCNAIITRDRFAYAVGMAYDEGGLLAVDLGTKTDQAGRYAWSGHLTAPALTSTPANCGTSLPVSGRLVFNIPGTGLLLEGVGPGGNREAWLQTSMMRFGTVEPKLWKVGRIRGAFADSEVIVNGITADGEATLATVGFTTTDPPEFNLPAGQYEWLAFKFQLSGTGALLRAYQAKALPGTRRQRRIKLVLAIYDRETTRSGQQVRDTLSARGRLAALEAMDTAGDEILFQEFTPSGVVNTNVVVESVSYMQIGRPTRTSDLGGAATVTLRTVES